MIGEHANPHHGGDASLDTLERVLILGALVGAPRGLILAFGVASIDSPGG